MKRKVVLGIGLTLLVVAGVFVWAPARTPAQLGARIPVTLLGYTNDPSGVLNLPYADTNIVHRGYAIFRIENPTRRQFFCYIGPVFFSESQIDLRRTQSRDFVFTPGESVEFAVPIPVGNKPGDAGFRSVT